jgi:hypothetical protein
VSGYQGANTTEGGQGFAWVGLGGGPSSELLSILCAEDIVPGSVPSYQTCKTLYAYHPLGAKIVDTPIKLAQSQRRELSVSRGPDERLIEAFNKEWDQVGGRNIDGSDVSGDSIILNLMRVSRMYGIASLIVGDRKNPQQSSQPLDLNNIADADLYFNVLDPLNTAGSLVLEQDPNSPDFQKVRRNIRCGSFEYHPSRSVVMMNEGPLYIEFTNSAFGFVGRSIYQRALYPMKTFLQTMITDQYVAIKIGLLIAKMKPPGSVVNNRILNFFGIKRQNLQSGVTGNVLSIGTEEDISSINFQNLEGPAELVRANALKNIAMAAGQPSKLLEMETMVGGMAEGTEDAKQIAHHIDDIRREMAAPYRFMDRIVQRRAWTEDLYKTIQKDYPEWQGVPYETALMTWINSFKAKWPNLLEEPDSEKIKVEETRFKSAVALVEVLAPIFDPVNKASLAGWAVDEVNSRRELFSAKLDYDQKAMEEYVPPTPEGGEEGEGKEPTPKPFGATT